VRLSALTDAMDNDVQTLTKGRQHLGMHVNFSGNLFVASPLATGRRERGASKGHAARGGQARSRCGAAVSFS
jgi:hypothetical protein